MVTALKTSSAYAAWVAAPAAAVYFMSPGCGVCAVLRPKVESLIAARFPRISLAIVDAAAAPELAAQAAVFSFPALIVLFDGREFLRMARNFSVTELERALERPYALWQTAEDDV
jgi:thioredoxin-like negative regulator of GroEL